MVPGRYSRPQPLGRNVTYGWYWNRGDCVSNCTCCLLLSLCRMIFLSNLNLFMAAKGLLGYIICINHFLLQKRPASQPHCPMPPLAGALIVPCTLRQGGIKMLERPLQGRFWVNAPSFLGLQN